MTAAARAPDGTVLSDLPESQQLLRDAFEAEPGLETPPLSMDDGGFLWFEVVDVTPARDRTLDEVRDEVAQDWTEMKTLEALGAKAMEMKERVERGAVLASIAEELSAAVETKYSLNRGGADGVFGEAAVASAFSGPSGIVAVANDASGENKILLQVTSVNDASSVTADAVSSEQRAQVSQQIADDILDQMVARLQAEYGVSVNQALAERALAF